MSGTITVTASSGTAAVGFQWELGMGGVADDGTTWLGGGSSYPGSLTPFSARQTDGTNDYIGGTKMLTVQWAGAADADTLTLSGEVGTIHSVSQGGWTEDAGGTAIAVSNSVSGLVITLVEAALGVVSGEFTIICS